MNIDEIRFDATKKESLAIVGIMQRARVTFPEYDPVDLEMDLRATNANGMPLDFEKLSNADYYNFAHDILGIRKHLNRNTGKLMRHFVPRCAKD